MSTRGCGLRANRPKILHRRASQSMTDTSNNSCDRERIPIVALNGRIIVTESFDKEQVRSFSLSTKIYLHNNNTRSTSGIINTSFTLAEANSVPKETKFTKTFDRRKKLS